MQSELFPARQEKGDSKIYDAHFHLQMVAIFNSNFQIKPQKTYIL